METKLIKSLAPMGMPGISLGLLYLLLVSFDFSFSTVSPVWSAIIIITIIIIFSFLTFYSLLYLKPKAELQLETNVSSNNIANIYWTGSDLMKAVCAIKHNKPEYIIRHCIVQFLYQLKMSKIIDSENKTSSLCLLSKYLEKLEKWPSDKVMDSNDNQELINIIVKIKIELTGLVDGKQPGYIPYPENNKDIWMKIKASSVEIC